MVEKVVCEVCGQEVKCAHTYDLWMLGTTYDSDGDPIKTGLEVDTPNDYFIVGSECCGKYVKERWEAKMYELMSQGG